MNHNTLSIITPDAANDAYADGIRKTRKLRQQAEMIRRIADALGSCYITKRLDAKLAELFPGFYAAVIVDRRYTVRKYITIHKRQAVGCVDDLNITLTGDDNRIDADALRKHADSIDAEAATLEDKLTRLYENVSKYNALAVAYAAVFDELDDLIEGMVHKDWGLRK